MYLGLTMKTFDEFVELASIRYISNSLHETVWESYRKALERYVPEYQEAGAFRDFADWMNYVSIVFSIGV